MGKKNHFLNMILIILIFTLNITFSQKLYTHYDYDAIFNTFEQLSKTCNHYVKIDTSQNRYNLDSYKSCGKKPCMNLIVFLTDFDSYTLDRPSYYISSSIHGDEVIGSSSMVEFVKYFCESYNYKKNSLYHNILKTKLIVMTPMTNAYGYYNKRREERVYIESSNKYIDVDPNRDFPYYNKKEEIFNCMRTLSARTINEIFNEFIISGAITFHGGDNVLGYPWGNYLHVTKDKYRTISTESPDFNAFDSIGKMMVKFSMSEKNEKNDIKKYGIGDMTSTVYPLDGALEDWAYGGWEKYELYDKNKINPIKTCKPDSFNSNYNMLWNLSYYNSDYNLSFNYDYKLRCLIYLAEASSRKIPKEEQYGVDDFDIKEDDRDIFDFYKTTDFFGHIPRNMRLVYTGVDLISSSIYLNINNIIKSNSNENNNIIKYTIPFIFMGCLTLRKYSIYKIPFNHVTKELLDTNYFQSQLNSSTLIEEYNNTNNIKCYYNSNTYFNLTIEIPYKNKNLRNLGKNDDPLHYFERPGGEYDYLGNHLGINKDNLYNKKGYLYIIRGEAPDEDWGKQQNPDPKVKPQSHTVRSKINKDYFVENGNYTLKSNYYFYSYPIITLNDEDINNNIKIVDDVDSLFYEDEFNFMKLIINSDNKEVNINPQIRFKKVNKDNNNLLTSENLFDVNVRIDIKLNQLNQNNNLISRNKNKNKNINLFSSILFPTDENNYLNCFHNINNENNIFISCNILSAKTGNYIRKKLPNTIIGFDLKKDKKTFLNFFGIFSFDENNKGKFIENNAMLCTNDIPFFINKEKENYNFIDDIYYKIKINKISNTKLKIKFDITINNIKYKNHYFLMFFPFCEDIFFFNETNKQEKIIDIKKNSDAKILGKIVYIIPVGKEVYRKIQNSEIALKNINNNLLNITLQLNGLSKRYDSYESFPCSIIEYNSLLTEESKNKFKKFFSKFNMDIYSNDKNINLYFIFGLILGGIALLIIIFIITIKTIKKYKAKFNKFNEEPVEISTSSNS